MNELKCECANWARATDSPYKLKSAEGLPLTTNHHPNCQHYNDSLMDVWRVSVDGISCYVDNEQDAKDTAGCDADEIQPTITKEKMHREIFENLAEFDGF
jgi:hypothetical protein